MLISRNTLNLVPPREFDKWVEAFRSHLGIETGKNEPVPENIWNKISEIKGVGFVHSSGESTELEEVKDGDSIFKIMKSFPKSSILWSAIWMVISRWDSSSKQSINNIMGSSSVKALLDGKRGPLKWHDVKSLEDNWKDFAKNCCKEADAEIPSVFLCDALDFWSMVLYGEKCDITGYTGLDTEKISKSVITLPVTDFKAAVRAFKEGKNSVKGSSVASSVLESLRFAMGRYPDAYISDEKKASHMSEVANNFADTKRLGAIVALLLENAEKWHKKREDFEALERGEASVEKTKKLFFKDDVVDELILPARDVCFLADLVDEWVKCGFKKSGIRDFIYLNASYVVNRCAVLRESIAGESFYINYHKCISSAVLHEAERLSAELEKEEKEKIADRASEKETEFDNCIIEYKKILDEVKEHQSKKEGILSETDFPGAIAKIEKAIETIENCKCNLDKIDKDVRKEKEREKKESAKKDLEETLEKSNEILDGDKVSEIKNIEAANLISKIEKCINSLKNLLDLGGFEEEKCKQAKEALVKLEAMLAEVRKKESSVSVSDKDVVETTDEYWRINCDEKVKVKFSLLPEEINELAFSNDNDDGKAEHKKYDYTAYHELVDAAVDVKRQSVFGDFAQFEQYDYFKPFKYQIDSVRTMLSRFEGRGVFGEQVGLGKTIEALMAAQTMHKCGTIRNAVIIVDNNCKQWENEINAKFRKDVEINGVTVTENIFDVEKPSFKALIEKLKENKVNESGKLKVYIITRKAVQCGKEIINKTNEIDNYKNAATKKLNENEIESIKNIEKDILEYVKDEFIDTPDFNVEYTGEEGASYGGNKKIGIYNLIKLEHMISLLIAECAEKVKEYEKTERITHGYHKTYLALLKNNGDVELKGATKKAVILIGENFNADVDTNVPLYQRRKRTADKLGYIWATDEIPEIVGFQPRFDAVKGNVNEIENIDDSKVARIVKNYNEKIKKIISHIGNIKDKIRKEADDNLYEKPRFIDLLIFDEVQVLLDVMNNNYRSETEETEEEFKAKKNTLELLHDFIARIQKKYCILLSATPIRDDLRDIFNLLYMVDNERLGETLDKAEARFYKTYCNGHKSLADMAGDDFMKSFNLLNGLINSMFTRQRLYDKNVIESMKRKTATEEEKSNACNFAHRRVGKTDEYKDYGGDRFMHLVRVVSAYANPEYKEEIERILNADPYKVEENEIGKLLKRLKDDFYKDKASSSPNKNFLRAIKGIYESINIFSEINGKREKIMHKMSDRNFEVNVCDAFMKAYTDLVQSEKEMKPRLEPLLDENIKLKEEIDKGGLTEDERKDKEKKIAENMLKSEELSKEFRAYDRIADMDILCGYINRGLLDFYKKRHEDEDVKYKETNGKNAKGKRGFSTIFLSDYVDWTRPYKEGKLVECKTKEEKVNYVIDALTPDENGDQVAKKLGLEDKDILDIQLGKVLVYESSAEEEREKMYESVPSPKYGVEDHRARECYINEYEKKVRNKGKNVEEFSKNTQGNWNAIYLIDQTQLVGTDFNTANILILNQLDTHEKFGYEYLEPLQMEQAIGRISRVGQTEVCKVFVTSYNGKDDSENSFEFNKKYYEILSDKDGFDLVGPCQTEVSFLVPVVMAFLRRMFEVEHQYESSEVDAFKNDKADFKVVLKKDTSPIPLEKNNNFTDILRFAIDNEDCMEVYCRDSSGEFKTMTPYDAIKTMIQVYSKGLRHKNNRSEA